MLRLLREQEAHARATLPGELFDYFDGGSGEEISRGEAEAAWQRFRFRPRVLRDVAAVRTEVDLFGTRLGAPIAVAPSASHGLLDPNGEIATAEGVSAAESLFVVSTRASRRIEEIAAVGAPWWLQVYVTRDRSLSDGLARRAADNGATALVLTGDTPFVARKARQGRPQSLSAGSSLVNFREYLAPDTDASWAAEQDPTITTDVIARLADLTGLPVLVKGVLRGDDARRCVDAGAAGLIVSNHGGRQLDRALPTAMALTDVLAAVAHDVPVLADGGIRSGAEVAIALALGARAVFLGRPVLWALAAGGSDGVRDALAALAEDFADTAALLGAADVSDLDPSLVAASDRGHDSHPRLLLGDDAP